MNHRPYKQAKCRLYVSIRFFGALFLIALSAGCANPTTTIRGDASRVSNPSLSVAIGIDDSDQTAAPPHTGHAIQIEATRARGGGNQTLAPGQYPVIFGATTFNAPQQLRHDFGITFADISYRWRNFFGESRFGLELTAGLGYSDMSLAVSSATQSVSSHYYDRFPKGSIAFIFRMRPSTSLHVRTTVFRTFSSLLADNVGIGNGSRNEIFFSQAIGNNIALRAGYAKWELYGSTGYLSSDFYLSFSGPTFNLGLNF